MSPDTRLLFLAAALAACDDARTPVPGGGGGAPRSDAGQGQVVIPRTGTMKDPPPRTSGLTVRDAYETWRLATRPVGADDKFTVVLVTVANAGADPLPLAPTSFLLATLSGDHAGDVITGQVRAGCRPGAEVAPGTTETCAVAFRIPRAATAVAIHHVSPSGGRLSTSVAPRPCSPCLTGCVDLVTDRESCGACERVCEDDCERGSCIAIRSSSAPEACTGLCAPLACVRGEASYEATCPSGARAFDLPLDCATAAGPTAPFPDDRTCTGRFITEKCFCRE